MTAATLLLTMKKSEFLGTIQSRVARIAVGPSTVRGKGNKGVVKAARAHLRALDLSAFSVRPAAFRAVLDRETKALVAALPRSARHWGIARKLLNIFLRDCLYTGYLEAAYRLSRAEQAYEIPLDSITAKHLKLVAGGGVLPRWPGVKYATPSLSDQYQRVAGEEAVRRGVARVHLDAVWWSVSRDRE